MSDMEGYYRMAMAMLQQVIMDLEHGTPARRAAARADILAGRLNRWVDMVCVTHHAHDAIMAKLHELAVLYTDDACVTTHPHVDDG